MNCAMVRMHMLDADLAELRAACASDEAASPLAAHVARCEECRAMAARLLAAERALAEALDRVHPRRGTDRAIALATGSAAWRHRRPRWRTLAPVAAAAGLIAVVVTQTDRDGPRGDAEPMVTARTAGLRVDVPAGRNAAVLETDNPDIIVVWFY